MFLWELVDKSDTFTFNNYLKMKLTHKNLGGEINYETIAIQTILCILKRCPIMLMMSIGEGCSHTGNGDNRSEGKQINIHHVLIRSQKPTHVCTTLTISTITVVPSSY